MVTSLSHAFEFQDSPQVTLVDVRSEDPFPYIQSTATAEVVANTPSDTWQAVVPLGGTVHVQVGILGVTPCLVEPVAFTFESEEQGQESKKEWVPTKLGTKEGWSQGF